MGYKSSSTRRTSAASAVSSQSVVVNTATGFTAVGSAIKSNTSISLGVTTIGQTTAASKTTVSAGPVIGNVQYLDANNAVLSDDIAVSTAGGNVLINGTGFAANSNIYVNNTLVSNTVISSTQIRAELPAASVGNVTLMIFTPTNVGTISPNAIRYSGFPSWTTAAVSLQNNIAANVALVVSGDSTLTYSLQDGSSLPTGISLSSSGYLSGTATGYTSSTSISAVIIATDLEGQAAQQTINFTITAGDDRFAYTTLLLNGETSATPFHADASSNNFGLTLAGDVRADRFSPYYDNGYYSYFGEGATSDYLSFPTRAGGWLPSGSNFTVEAWVNMSKHPQAHPSYAATIAGTAGNANGWEWTFNGSNGSNCTGLTFSMKGVATATYTGTLAINTWYHVAAVRNGTTLTVYVNGVAGATTGTLTSWTDNTTLYIGADTAPSYPLYFYGYISNFRITSNTALYTSAFTPPTGPLTATANTLVLACQSNRYVDNSPNNFTITKNGTGNKISPATPFAASGTYATYGSAYFDGTGDYLTGSLITFGTNAFTIEFWWYPTSLPTNSMLISAAVTSGAAGPQVQTSGTSINLGTYGVGNSIATSGGLVLGQWHHIVIVRSGTGTNQGSIFINGNRAANGTVSTNYAAGTIVIGGLYAGTGQMTFGYIADVRVNNGTAVYNPTLTTLTVPSAPLTAVTNTQLLTCQYNGGANNSGIVDNGPFDAIVTRNGNASQGTFSPFSPTGWSNYFNGTSGVQTTTASTNSTIPTSTTPFTLEAWVYVTSSSTLYSIISTSQTTYAYTLGLGSSLGTYDSTPKPWFGYYSGGWNGVTSSVALSMNTWTHVAAVFTGSTCKIYVNGVETASGGPSTWGVVGGSDVIKVGTRNDGANYFTGYISNARVVIGTAAYTSAFTPPTAPLQNITNTKLLTCQSNQFVDNSSNNSALSLTSAPSVQAFSPFAPSAAYDPTLHGGSAYFDGTGDFLSMPGSNSTNIGASTATAFTVEAWVYPTATKDTTVIGCAGSAWRLALTSSNTVSWVFNTSSSQTSTAAIKLNQWNHIAFTYDGLYTGSSNKIFVNGVVQAAQGQLIPSSNTSGIIYVGRNADSAAWDFQGYISGARIIRGYAAYTANFILPTAPATSPTTTPASLLLNFTNGGITDKHSSNTLGTVGNAQLSTAVKKYGNASMQFDGTGDYAQFVNKTARALYLSSGNWTVEFWVYHNTTGTYDHTLVGGTSFYDVIFGVFNYGAQIGFWNNNTFYGLYASSSLTAGTWRHLAYVRNGNTVTLYINGTSVGSTAFSGSMKEDGSNDFLTTVVGSSLNGYMDDVRITKGFARYTANFTPPTSALLGQ